MAYFKCVNMKTIFVMACLAIAGSTGAQSLKDALYSGKLKADTGQTVRKGDSLKIREEKPKVESITPSGKVATTTDTSAAAIATNNSGDSTAANPSAVSNTVPTTQAAPAALDPNKENNRIWKQFVDEYTTTIQSEVMTSKKIKSGMYYVFIEYEIGTDGVVTTRSVTCSPENSFLVDQINKRMMINAPQLMPLPGVGGKPRKAVKKQALTFTK